MKHKIITHGNSKVIDGHLEQLYEQNQNMMADMTRMRNDIRALHTRMVTPSFFRRLLNRWQSRRALRIPKHGDA